MEVCSDHHSEIVHEGSCPICDVSTQMGASYDERMAMTLCDSHCGSRCWYNERKACPACEAEAVAVGCTLNNCSSGHEEIHYAGVDCPLCEMKIELLKAPVMKSGYEFF